METGSMLSLKGNVVVENEAIQLQDSPQIDQPIRPRLAREPQPVLTNVAGDSDEDVQNSMSESQAAETTHAVLGSTSSDSTSIDEMCRDCDNMKGGAYHLVHFRVRDACRDFEYSCIVFSGAGGVVYQRGPVPCVSDDDDDDDDDDDSAQVHPVAPSLRLSSKFVDLYELGKVKIVHQESKNDNDRNEDTEEGQVFHGKKDQKGWKKVSHRNEIKGRNHSQAPLSKWPIEGLNGFRKMSGKRQRWKKVNSLLGMSDTFWFQFLQPAPVRIVTYPAKRQNSKSKGARKSQNGSSHQPQLGVRSWLPAVVHGMPQETFRHELQRMGTFVNMPPNLQVFALRMAQAGFLCLDDGSFVCYFCGLRLDNKDSRESPLVAHRQQRPSCPMLRGEAGDNVPVGVVDVQRVQELMEFWSLTGPLPLPPTEPSSHAPAVEVTGLVPAQSRGAAGPSQGNVGPPAMSNQSALFVEDCASAERHASGSAPNQPPAVVATATLPNIDVNRSDNQTARQQQPGSAEPAAATHLTAAENSTSATPAAAGNAAGAAILDGTAQPQAAGSAAPAAAQQNQPRTGQQVVTYQQLGIVTEPPKHPDMALNNARVATYRNWPSTRSHTPLVLSEAGFYYAGYADCGRCFFCGGGLKNWDPVDNPWVEHARWFPKCAYVRQCQGQDFVDIVQEMNSGDERRQISLAQVMEEMRRRQADGDHLQEPMIDPAITSALGVGFTQEEVDAAVQRMQREGHTLTAARLVDCLQAQGSEAAGVDDEDPDPDDVAQVAELTTSNSEIRQQRICKICLDKEVCIVFLPCGHLVCCAECSPALRNCPMCRQRIKGKVRAFPG